MRKERVILPKGVRNERFRDEKIIVGRVEKWIIDPRNRHGRGAMESDGCDAESPSQ
jgi:hypothetical protein